MLQDATAAMPALEPLLKVLGINNTDTLPIILLIAPGSDGQVQNVGNGAKVGVGANSAGSGSGTGLGTEGTGSETGTDGSTPANEKEVESDEKVTLNPLLQGVLLELRKELEEIRPGISLFGAIQRATGAFYLFLANFINSLGSFGDLVVAPIVAPLEATIFPPLQLAPLEVDD